MDDQVIGRERADEVAILEELSGAPSSVGGADRRWLLAIAGMAAIVCLGFAGNLAAPTPTERAEVAVPTAGQASPFTGIDELVIVPQRAAIELVRPAPGSVVTDGSVPIELVAAAGSHVRVSLAIGAAVLGWRNVDIDDSGRWSGTLSVFAPQVALPAIISAAGSVNGTPLEAHAAITLGHGTPLQLWSVWVDRTSDGTLVVRYLATAPLALNSVQSWVSDRGGRLLGASSDAVAVDDWISGSAGARGFGMGSVSGFIPLNGRVDDVLTFHATWKDTQSQAWGGLEKALDASAAAAP